MHKLIRFHPAHDLSPEQLIVARLQLILITTALGIVEALLVFFGDSLILLVPPCPFHALTGLKCPFCGATTGLLALLSGDVIGMIKANVLYVVALPIFLYWLVGRVWMVLRRRAIPAIALTKSGWILTSIFLVGFMAGRNISLFM